MEKLKTCNGARLFGGIIFSEARMGDWQLVVSMADRVDRVPCQRSAVVACADGDSLHDEFLPRRGGVPVGGSGAVLQAR